MKNPEHFVFICNQPKHVEWGGLEKLICEWLEHIDYEQCQASLVVSLGWKGIYDKAIKSRGLPVNVIETNLDYSLDPFKKYFIIRDLLIKLRPTTCVFIQGHFYSFHFAHIFAAWNVSGTRVFIHENLGAPQQPVRASKKHFRFIPGLGLWWHAERLQRRLKASFCKKILTVSEGVKKDLIEIWDYPKEKIEVCYHGIDLGQFNPAPHSILEIRKNLGIHQENKVIIVSARLTKLKCVDRVIDAFDELAVLDPALELLILGSGILEKELKDLAASKRSRSRIEFLGHQDKVSDYLKAGDYFVLSSDNEGLGLSLLEAMASGLICISTRCPGPMEIIQDGTNGFFVEKSSQGVKEGLKKALAMSSEQRQQISENAVKLVARTFELKDKIKFVFFIIGIPFREA